VTAALPHPLHPRLTVVRLDGGEPPDGLARRLAATLAGLGAVDLRADAAVVDATSLHADAVARAAAGLQLRAAERDRAVAHRAGLAARRTHLLEQAEWCQGAAASARAVLAALDDAEARVAAARADVDAAAARRERVADQRAAAQAAVDEAELALEGLDGATLDESGVRRELESATRAERDAAAARDRAEAELEALGARLAQLRAEEEQLEAAIAELDALLAARPDPGAVAALRDALAVYDELALLAGPDPEAVEVADALRRTDAALDDLRRRLPEPPTDDQLAAAEADYAAARREVDAARAAAASFDGPPPAWWVELTALHAAVVDAEAALGSGLRKGAHRRRYEEALAAERARLDELGFPAYLDALTSGGRLPSERAADEGRIAEATARLSRTERHVESLRRDLLAGAPLVDRIVEQERLLSIAADLLGLPADHDVAVAEVVERLEQHRAVPMMAVDEVAVALAGVGAPVPGEIHRLVPAARAWLAANGQALDPGRRDELAGRRAHAVEERRSVESAIGPATAVAERAVADATAAARTVTSLEAELHARAGDDGRLFERAVAARELRDQVAAVEARLAAADTEALEAWARASDVLAAAETERDRLAGELATLQRRASRASAELPPERRPPVDLLTGLVALAGALRADATTLAGELAEADRVVTDAEAAADGAATPTPADIAEALRAALGAGTGPVVLAEPFADLDAPDVDALLGLLAHASAERPTVVVTGDLAVIGWAIGLPAEVGCLVPARSLDQLVPPALPGEATATDTAVTARRTAD